MTKKLHYKTFRARKKNKCRGRIRIYFIRI